MAVTTENSAEYARAIAGTGDKNEANEAGGSAVKPFCFTFVQGAAAGDDGSLVNLIKIPPGRWRMFTQISSIQWDALGASRTLDIGWPEYLDTAGVAVAADEDGIETAIDASSAGQQLFTGDGVAAGAGRNIEFNSSAGVIIQANVEGGTLPAGAKLSGTFFLSPS